MPLNEDLVGVAINILPVSETRTVAAFSYAKKDQGSVRAAFDRILGSTGDVQKYELFEARVEPDIQRSYLASRVRELATKKSPPKDLQTPIRTVSLPGLYWRNRMPQTNACVLRQKLGF